MSGRYYRRGGYGNWYRGGRYYGRRRYYVRNSISRANGNIRAAKQQADQSTFTINVPSQISAFCNTPNDSDYTRGVYAMNIYDQLRKSEFFQNYANMYDEFKIDKIKVKLLPTQWATNLDGQRFYKNLTVYTAWDRSGLNYGQVFMSITNANQITRLEEKDYLLGNENGGGLAVIIGNDITSYSSAESRVVNPNTNTSIVRWLSPKTISEKSQWLSTGLLKEWYKSYDSNEGIYKQIPLSNKVGGYVDSEFSSFTQIIDAQGQTASLAGILEQFTSPLSSDNPCSLFEDNGIRFKPTLLVGIYPNDNNVINIGTQEEPINVPANKITFNTETEVVCTFRGLRKSKVVAA